MSSALHLVDGIMAADVLRDDEQSGAVE